MSGKIAWLLPLAVLAAAGCGAPPKPPSSVWGGVGMDEKLGALVPLDAQFRDEEGAAVSLRTLVKAPTILALVYYHCPDSCTVLTQGMAQAIAALDAVPGADFTAITVSFDSTETPRMAAEQKRIALAIVGARFPPREWRFLTGDAASVNALTAAVGFHYVKQGDDYAHPLGLIILSPQGKIVRYMSGTDFLPLDLRMALLEASEGVVKPTIAKFVRFCFSYNAQSHQYVFNILKVTAIVVLLLAASFVTYLVVATSRKRRTGEGVS
jgi:protein SCO1/2